MRTPGAFLLVPRGRAAPVLLAALLSVSLTAAAETPSSPASALPASLAEPLQALLDAPAQGKEAACDRLLDVYVGDLGSGKDIPEVDRAIIASLGVEARAGLAARLAVAGVFSPLEKACLESLSGKTLGGLQGDFVDTAASLYRSLERLASPEPVPPGGWAGIAAGLRAGWRYFPSLLYSSQLENALRKAGDRRGLFEFTAYRYLDESNPAPLGYARLLLRWLAVPGRRPLRAEIAAVKRSIKEDVRRTSPGVLGMPLFGREVFYTSEGAARELSFILPGSGLFGKRALFVFFDTTCPYCVEELRALSRLVPAIRRNAGDGFAVIGLKIPTRLPPPIGALAPFEKNLAPAFPLLQNPDSLLSAAYGVRGVPLILFLDERGVPLWTVVFHGQARLEEKLTWFMEDFLGDRQAAAPSPAAGGKSITVDLYLDRAGSEAGRRIE
jgi:hypothetical protein